MSEGNGSGYTEPVDEPVDVGALPEDQGPSVSEESFLSLQKRRPLPAGIRREGEKARPSDITVTGPAYEFRDPNAATDLSSSQILRQAAAMSPRRSSNSPRALRSSSPRHLSPATSQIFERDVQESTLGGAELSPAIPSHIQTEDHIPPVLEASSEVITNSRLDPENVEIVTHTSHQPAAFSVAASTILGESQLSHAPSVSDLGMGFSSQEPDDTSSSYGAVDPSDPRRLSFISFADVVHAEHVDASKEAALGSSHLMSPLSFNSPRSSSPARSPVRDRIPSLSHAGTGVESSPTRSGGTSIVSGHSTSQHGDLTIETMAKTMENTSKGDLTGGLPGTATTTTTT